MNPYTPDSIKLLECVDHPTEPPTAAEFGLKIFQTAQPEQQALDIDDVLDTDEGLF